MAKFFIDRPVFAWVIAIVLMMAGALSILKLPVSQYPNIAPPAIGIAVTYPGASAPVSYTHLDVYKRQALKSVDDPYMDFGAGQFIWRMSESDNELGYVAASDSRRDGQAVGF